MTEDVDERNARLGHGIPMSYGRYIREYYGVLGRGFINLLIMMILLAISCGHRVCIPF